MLMAIFLFLVLWFMGSVIGAFVVPIIGLPFEKEEKVISIFGLIFAISIVLMVYLS